MHSNPKAPDDSQLVAQTLAGDREAFGLLFDRYARLVRAVAWAAENDWTATQDLTQECFLRAYRQLASLRKREHFRFWVTGIARQLVRERRRRRRPESLALEAAAAQEKPSLDDRDEMEHVLGLVARLPDQERLAIHCFFLSERNIGDTALLLDLSRSGTYEVIKRACARLKGWLGACESEQETSP
jgi:RNA polymerase sigma-70 factor (ECF subfamily)